MARRRKSSGPEMTLFPFLSVLAAVMGTLILIIAGMSQIALANPKQRVEVEVFNPKKKSAIYVECTGQGMNIYPDDPTSGMATFVERWEMHDADSAWLDLVSRLKHDTTRYIILLVRADGVGTFTDARATLSGTGIDVGYEPLFGTGGVRFRGKGR